MNYFKVLPYLFILFFNAVLSAEIIDDYYASINFNYEFSEGNLDGDGFQIDSLYQFTGGEDSGFAVLASNSTITVDEIFDSIIDPNLSLKIDQSSFGLGYIFKNIDWHVIPYFTSLDVDVEHTGNFFSSLDFANTYEATTFGIMFRTAISSSIAITYNINMIKYDDTPISFSVDGNNYILNDDTALSFRVDQSISEVLSITYGAKHSHGINTFSGGLSFQF